LPPGQTGAPAGIGGIDFGTMLAGVVMLLAAAAVFVIMKRRAETA
jgi:uncharacterized membrane-anchored protein